MAGIAGIIALNKSNNKDQLDTAWTELQNGMAYSSEQLKASYEDEGFRMGNVLPLALEQNEQFVQADPLAYHLAIEGMLFVSDMLKKELEERYQLEKLESEEAYLPYLFDLHGADMGLHLSGWYNIVVYDSTKQEAVIINDRLGYLPLFYYQDGDLLLFASKLEALLDSGLMKEVKIDEVSIAEHLFFNYTLSEHTYIQGIKTLSDASRLCFKPSSGLEIERYWEVGELFGIPALDKKTSIDLIDKSLKASINKMLAKGFDKLNFSLTGGWDSRVVLSYLLPGQKDKLRAYSFGASEAPDITIPQEIARKEGFSYQAYKLGDQYVKEDFMGHALETIRLSNGTRNYKRTHYLYAIKQVARESKYLLTGIFGDEIFKVGKPEGGTVITSSAVDFIGSNFDVEQVMDRFSNSGIPEILKLSSDSLMQELRNRLNLVSERFRNYSSPGERYFAFRFTLNLRKYFGNEVNSYNDFVYCFSPFIDHDFLKEFAKTEYMASRFPYEETDLKLKAQSSWLYYKLTNSNWPNLTRYNTSRGFSMKATQGPFGIIRILFIKSVLKRFAKKKDAFNTGQLDKIFKEYVERDKAANANSPLSLKGDTSGLSKADLYSLELYINRLTKRYQIDLH